jgi:hypothetical protein
MEAVSVSFENPPEKSDSEISQDERESMILEIFKSQLDAVHARIKVFFEEMDGKLEVI